MSNCIKAQDTNLRRQVQWSSLHHLFYKKVSQPPFPSPKNDFKTIWFPRKVTIIYLCVLNFFPNYIRKLYFLRQKKKSTFCVCVYKNLPQRHKSWLYHRTLHVKAKNIFKSLITKSRNVMKLYLVLSWQLVRLGYGTSVFWFIVSDFWSKVNIMHTNVYY